MTGTGFGNLINYTQMVTFNIFYRDSIATIFFFFKSYLVEINFRWVFDINYRNNIISGDVFYGGAVIL